MDYKRQHFINPLEEGSEMKINNNINPFLTEKVHHHSPNNYFNNIINTGMCKPIMKENMLQFQCFKSNTSRNMNIPLQNIKIISDMCVCSHLPKSMIIINNKQIPVLWDTGASASVMPLHILNKYIPNKNTDIIPTSQTMFAAGQKKLEVLGILNVNVIIGLITNPCTFVIIKEKLDYAILGFDFMKPQQISCHPQLGIIQISSNMGNQNKSESVYTNHLHGLQAKTPEQIQIHECIKVVTVKDEKITKQSSSQISVEIQFKQAENFCLPEEQLGISSDCIQPEETDWKQLSVFFQLVPARKFVTIIYTNKLENEVSIPSRTQIGCAEYCFSAIQVDPRITINNAPLGAILNIMENHITDKRTQPEEIKSQNVDLQEIATTSSQFDEDLGIDIPVGNFNDQNLPIDLTKISMGNEDVHERQFMENLVTKHPEIISKSQWDLGLFNEAPAHISVKSGVHPRFCKQAAIVDDEIREVAEAMINELEERGLIKETNSPWNSPLIILRKSPREHKIGSILTDGSICKVPGRKRSKWDRQAGLRFVISLKYLNSVSKPCPDQGMLPKITEQLNQLRNYTILHSIDFSGAYWQLPIDQESQEKTSFFFNTPYISRQFQLCRLPQGFRDSSAIFTNRAHRFIQRYGLYNCLSYIDNFLIGSTEETAKEDIAKVFAALSKAGLKIRLEKSHFFLRQKVTIFGYTVDLRHHSIHPDIRKVEAVLKTATPISKKEVKSFLGKIEYYYRLVPGLNVILDPLFAITSPNAKFKWDYVHMEAFQKAKKQLARGPLIYMASNQGPRHLVVDAAMGQGIASAIFDYNQETNQFLPLRYTSHPLRGSQLNYSQFSVEAFGMVRGVRENVDIIAHTLTYLYTDCQSLVWLVRMKSVNSKAARWLEFLEGFNIQVVFLPSSHSVIKVVDFLSRPMSSGKQTGKKPLNINQNIFDFEKIKPCAIQKLVEILQKLFKSPEIQLAKPEIQDINMIETLPNIFRSEVETANFAYNTAVHKFDNEVSIGHGLLANILNISPPSSEKYKEGSLKYFEDSSRLIPFPKDYVTIQNEKKDYSTTIIEF